MFIATVVISALIAALLLVSARGKLVRDPAQMTTMSAVGFPESKLWLLASAEIAGAVGLVVGLFWWPLGVAAAVGVVAYFVGAAGAHMRIRDIKGATTPVVILVVTAVDLVLRAVSS
jgi:hypothetical protein